VVIPPYLVDDKPTRDDLRQYYDEIQRFDRFIGLCLEEVERQGELDNTMVIVMGDNGRPFPRCKTRLYDSGLKTPFVVAYPPIVTELVVCDSLVSSIDIAPTILELAGLDTPAAMQGVSFVPLLEDPEATIRNYAFGEHNWHDFKAHERMCCDGRFLYIRNNLPELPASQPGQALARGGAYLSLVAGHKAGTLKDPQKNIFVEPRTAEELFAVTGDYHQLANLVDDPQLAETLKRMRALLDRWIDETGDTCPDDLTVDVCDRYNANAIIAQPDGTRSMRPARRGVAPGSERNATAINNPGPR
jgi:arylsulfatase A-like enzyme